MSVRDLGNGRWLVEIDREGLKRVRKRFRSREDAEAFERDFLRQTAKASASGVVDRRRLSELVALWSRYHGINLADFVKRERCLLALCRELGDPIAAQLSAEAWVEFRYRTTLTGPAEERVTAKTFNNWQGYLSAVFHRLRKLRVIEYECPLAAVEPIKIQERQLAYLSIEQIGQLLSVIKEGCVNPCTWWVAQVCLRTGARWGEAEKLRRKQIYPDRVTFEFTKSKHTRTVPLDPAFVAALLKDRGATTPEARLFSSCIGSFRRAVVRSGIELPAGQCSHILRHSFASHFVMRGGNILALQKILGHQDIKMTLRYSHLAPEHLIDAARLNPLA